MALAKSTAAPQAPSTQPFMPAANRGSLVAIFRQSGIHTSTSTVTQPAKGIRARPRQIGR